MVVMAYGTRTCQCYEVQLLGVIFVFCFTFPLPNNVYLMIPG